MGDEQFNDSRGRSLEEPLAAPGDVPPANHGQPHSPPPYGPPPAYCYPPPPPPKRSRLGTFILAALLVASLLGNLLLMIVVVAVSMSAPSRPREALNEVIVDEAETDTRVALLHIEGIITEQRSGRTAVAADYEYVKQQVERILKDRNVRGVVIRVNSPGGGASASDMILKQLQRLRDERQLPVVVHMGSMAASGGYYVAMAGEHIIAQPTTITGSIGVIAQFFSLENLMNEKLGIETYIVESGERKSMGTPFRDMTPEEQLYMRETIVLPMYERFIEVIVAGRPDLPTERLRELADGRVLNADQALAAGLIDDIGYQQDAVDYVMQLARIERAKVVQYERRVSLFDVLGLSAANATADLTVSQETVQRLTQPQILMQWCP